MKRFSIGVDPGKHTGAAVYDRKERRLIEVVTIDFWRFAFDFHLRYPPNVVHKLIVELPNTTAVWHKKAKKREAIEKTAVNVGKSLREAELLADWAGRVGYEVITRHPQGKVDDAIFRRITGWKGRTSQHARDAAMLCFEL
jgi:hypothetical protein